MKPIDYFLNLAEGSVPIPKNLNIRAIEEEVESNAFTFHFNQYAMRRAADWKERGFIETLIDFHALNARSKFWGDDQRASFKNWEEMTDMRNPRRSPGHRRAHHDAGASASRGNEGHLRKSPRCRRAPPLFASSRKNRIWRLSPSLAATFAVSCAWVRLRASPKC